MTTKIIRPVEITEPVFTRASTATYLNAAGLLVTAAVNERRPLFTAGVQTGWVQEAAARNLLTYSEQFDDAVWVKNSCTVTANAAAGPDGAVSADRLIESAGSAVHHIVRSAALSGGKHSFSVFSKAVGSRTLLIQVEPSTGTYIYACINLTTGAVVVASAASISVTGPTSNGYYLCAITFDTAGGNCNCFLISANLDGGQSTAGDGSSGLYLFGAQLAAGPPSSYIRTTTSTVVRAVDVLTGSGRDLVFTNAVETVPEWAAATSYAVGAKVLRTTVGRIFMNKLAGVDATLPELAPTRWDDTGPSNHMAMFDKEVGSVTTAQDSITVVLHPGGINALALQEMRNANQVRVVMKDAPGGVVVFEQTIDLEFVQVLDVYDWFFLPYEARTDAQLTDLPEFPDCEVTVTISGGGTVGCGLLALGTAVSLGGAEYGASLGIINRSLITTNAYGRTTITKRGYHRTMDLKVWVEHNALNRFFRFLAEIKDTPCVYLGDDSDGNEALIVYGIYRDLSIVLSYPTTDLYNFRIEGMTL